MDIKVASHFYNTVGVCPRTDPDCEESRFAVDRFASQLARTIKPGMRVLDLGCNAGRFVFAAEELGASPVGIDCAAVPLEHARKLAERRGSCVRFVLGDYCALPFPPASFDLALLINNIVECSYDQFAAIVCQLHRILAPGGLFCVSMPDRLAQHQMDGRSLADYDPATGRRVRISYVTDDGEEIPYHGYFWTVPFAKCICSQYMGLCEEETSNDRRNWWLVFRNGGA